MDMFSMMDSEEEGDLLYQIELLDSRFQQSQERNSCLTQEQHVLQNTINFLSGEYEIREEEIENAKLIQEKKVLEKLSQIKDSNIKSSPLSSAILNENSDLFYLVSNIIFSLRSHPFYLGNLSFLIDTENYGEISWFSNFIQFSLYIVNNEDSKILGLLSEIFRSQIKESDDILDDIKQESENIIFQMMKSDLVGNKSMNEFNCKLFQQISLASQNFNSSNNSEILTDYLETLLKELLNTLSILYSDDTSSTSFKKSRLYYQVIANIVAMKEIENYDNDSDSGSDDNESDDVPLSLKVIGRIFSRTMLFECNSKTNGLTINYLMLNIIQSLFSFEMKRNDDEKIKNWKKGKFKLIQEFYNSLITNISINDLPQTIFNNNVSEISSKSSITTKSKSISTTTASTLNSLPTECNGESMNMKLSDIYKLVQLLIDHYNYVFTSNGNINDDHKMRALMMMKKLESIWCYTLPKDSNEEVKLIFNC